MLAVDGAMPSLAPKIAGWGRVSDLLNMQLLTFISANFRVVTLSSSKHSCMYSHIDAKTGQRKMYSVAAIESDRCYSPSFSGVTDTPKTCLEFVDMRLKCHWGEGISQVTVPPR